MKRGKATIDEVQIRAGRLLIVVDVGFQRVLLSRPPGGPIECSVTELLAAYAAVQNERRPS